MRQTIRIGQSLTIIYKDREPMIEYDLSDGKIYAYPAADYIDNLNSRTRDDTLKRYRDAIKNNLFQTIRAVFERGFEVSPDVLRYIHSTLSHPSLAELEEILSDETHCEREPILELLFFPDESFQISIEEIPEAEDYHEKMLPVNCMDILRKICRVSTIF